MRLKHKMTSTLLVLVMVMGLGVSVSATNLRDAQSQEDKLESQQKKAEEEKASLQARVDSILASMSETEARLQEKQVAIETTEQEIIMARVNVTEQYKSMKQRIRYMYENGNVDYVELFMESQSLADFLNKAEYITKLTEYDRNQLTEFENTLQQIEQKEQTLQAEYSELTTLQASLSQQCEEAESLLKEKSSELASINADLKKVRTQIANAKNEERLNQEMNSSGSSGNTSSGSSRPPVVSGNGYFTHPCPGMSYQSSYFGEIRTSIGDPIPHKGHDYAAPAGTPIYAAAAGTVVTAGYSYSAGNWVVIDHGNGLVTKYMHMYAWPLVSVYQKVEKGQHIGGVGTTGQSTGNHLHFQVELNGKPVNPSNYM